MPYWYVVNVKSFLKKIQEEYYKNVNIETLSIENFVFQQNDAFFDIFDRKPVFNVLNLTKRKYYLDKKQQFFVDNSRVYNVNGTEPWLAFSHYSPQYLIKYHNGKREIIKYPKIIGDERFKVENSIVDNGNVVYFKLMRFEEAIIPLLMGKENKNLVIDLCDNSGGSVVSMLRFLDMFISGPLFFWKKKEERYLIQSSENKKVSFQKIIIIVNKNTASAAEIFVDVLCKKCGGIIIGEKTFGKWVAHKVMNFEDYYIKVPAFIYEDCGGTRHQNFDGLRPDYIIDFNKKNSVSNILAQILQ